MKIVRIVGFALFAVVVLVSSAIGWQFYARPGLPAYAAHHYSPPPAQPGALTATWFGVTAVLLTDGQQSIFIDPFFTRPEGLWPAITNAEIGPDEPLIQSWLDRFGIKSLDAVLVSHSHYDHAMDAGVVARLTGAVLIGSPSTANIGRGAGLPESQSAAVRPGADVQLGAFHITFLESQHAGASGGRPTGEITAPLKAPFHYLDYKQGGTFSILVEHPQGSVLHHGSAGFVPGALKGRHADLVFLGVALLPDLKSYLAETVDLVGAKRVVPVHWDDFTRPLDQPLLPFPVVVRLDTFFEDITHQRPDLSVQTLELGIPVALFPPAAAAAAPTPSPAASPPR